MIRILHDLLYMIPLCLLVAGVGEPYFPGPGTGVLLRLCACAALCLCMVIKHWKNRVKYLFPCVIPVLVVSVLLTVSPEEWGEFLWSNRWVLFAIATALISFFMGWLWVSVRAAGRIFAGLVLAGLILTMVLGWTVEKSVVDLGLFLLILFAADEIQHFWKKSGYPDSRGHLAAIAPFLLILGVAVYLVPAPEKPYDWDFAVRIWEKVTDVIKWTGQLFGPDEDYDAVVGFSEGGSFYSGLSEENETLMTLSGKKETGTVVYLRGKVMDTFDGRNWTDTYSEENSDDSLDVLETLCAVNTYDPEHFGDYLRRVDVRLRYEEFNTRYLFAPLKAALRNNRIDELEFTQEGGDLVADEKLGYGTEYVVPYYRMNRDHNGFAEFLRSARTPDESVWETTRTGYNKQDTGRGSGSGTADTSYRDYQEYKKRIRRYYLPETHLSGSVDQYLDKLLDGAETDYDRLSRIESLLSSFRYTDTPGALPEEITTPEAFLDEFIMKKREGYCSYFATAFVLMARSRGIPARYVQGFRVTTKGRATAEVKSDMSHAWPEAYIDGVGWIGFEPTPGKQYRVVWSASGETESAGTDDDPMTDRMEYPTPEPAAAESEPAEEAVPVRWSILLIPAGLLAVILLVFLLAERIRAAARYRHLDEAGRFREICKRNFRILGFLGYRIGQGETLQEFYDRVHTEIDADAIGFLRSCEYVVYAGKTADTGMLAEAAKNREALTVYLKKAKGMWFFWYRFRS